MKYKDLIGKYVYSEKHRSLWIIRDIFHDFLYMEIGSNYPSEDGLAHISALNGENKIYRIVDDEEVESIKNELKIDYYTELETLMADGDLKIYTEDLSFVFPSKSPNIFLLNFYGPTDILEFEDVAFNLCFSNLGEFFRESQTNWSVPSNANVGDIVVFMCANTSIAKMRHVCAQVKDEYGKESLMYELAVAERNLYEKYSGHIVGWGVITKEPEYLYGERLGYADVNINDKYVPAVPYALVKDLFKLNAYGSVTKLTAEQWDQIQTVIRRSMVIKEKEPKKMTELNNTSDEKILRVDDKLLFSKKLDYLEPYFGVHSFMTALYPEKAGNLPIVSKTGENIGTYFIWSANENPNDSGCSNILNPDGTKLVEIMPESFVLPESIGQGRPEPDLRVVFTKSKDTGKWMFRGVFKAIFDTKIKGPKRYANIYFRVATEIAIKQDSTKAIRILNLYSAESFR